MSSFARHRRLTATQAEHLAAVVVQVRHPQDLPASGENL